MGEALEQAADCTPRARDKASMRREVADSTEDRFTVSAVCVTDGAVLDTLGDAWIELASRACGYSMCQTFPFCRAAYDIGVPKNGVAYLLTAFEGRQLAAVWLLQSAREGLFRFLWPLGSGSNDEYGGPLVQADGEYALNLLMVKEAAKLRADVFQVFAAPGGSATCRALEAFQLQGSGGATRTLIRYKLTFAHPTSWDAFLASRSKSFRAELRSDLKRLEMLGPVERDWCKTPEESDAMIDWVFENKLAWTRSRGLRSGRIFDGGVQAFFKALVRRVDLATIPLVTFVKSNGVPIAASLNFVDPRNIEFGYTTYDEEFGRFSPGLLLVGYCARLSVESGRNFDFRMLWMSYKERWSNSPENIKTYTLYNSNFAKIYELRHILFNMRVALGRTRRNMMKLLSK